MNRIVLTSILLFFMTCCFGQEIKSIRFEGLSKTKASYLDQFIKFQEGDPLDSLMLLQARQTLVNLEMFSDVQFQVEEADGGVEVVFQFEELFTLLPIFGFGGIEENFWFQLGASEVNLGGRGNKLTTYYQYYDRSSLAAHLTLDRLNQGPWGVNINLVKWSTLEPLFFDNQTVEYEYDNYTVGVNAIYHFNYRDNVTFGGAFFTEDYRKFTEGTFADAPNKVDKSKLLGKAIFTWNHVNYHYYFLDGLHNQLNLQTVQSLDEDPAFYIFFNDVKRFWRNGTRGNLATRLRLGLSSNRDSPFAPFVLDSYVNIRGVGNRVDRGTGAIILNAEYRHSFIDRGKVAIQGVVFSDSGTWRNPGGEFSDFSDSDNFALFAGGGLRFIHKRIYNAIFRVDYGFDLQQPESNGFVLGIGQYF